MTDAQFHAQLKALCDSHGLPEFALYAKTHKTVDAKGKLCPAQPVFFHDNDPILLEEASYYFNELKIRMQVVNH